MAFSGLTQPIAVQFSQDGRVFVAEKSGIIKVFDGLGDTTPTTFADLRTQVHNYWDRGVEGLALHPNFPATPYVYVYYVADAPIGGTAPTWGTAGATSDSCPDPPGGTGDGCVVSGRISRLTASGNTMTGPEHVLVSGLVPAVPEPRRRRHRVRRRRLPLLHGRRGRRLALRRLRPGRRARRTPAATRRAARASSRRSPPLRAAGSAPRTSARRVTRSASAAR